jgi:prolyl oligopeptidase
MNRFQRQWIGFVLLALAVAGLGIMGCTQVKQRQTSTGPWDQLFADYWNFNMERNPLSATYLGDHRFDDRLPDPSRAARELEIEQLQQFMRRAAELIQQGQVAPDDSLDIQLFLRELKIELEDFRWHDEYMPMTQQSGPQIDLPELVSYHPLKTVQDVENYIIRLKRIPEYIRQTIINMNLGRASGLVPARNTIEKALPQVEAHIVADPEKSVFAGAIARMDSAIPEPERQRLRRDILDAIRGSVIYGYEMLAAFLKTDYLPACRDTVGWLALPEGRERYANRVRRYTTIDLTPQQVYNTGMKELEWIRAEMEKIKDSVGFRGNLRAFIEHLKTDPQFHFTSADSLVDGFKRILAEMDTKMPLLFGRLPKTPYSYREIEPYRAAAAPDAYYYPPPEDGSRPGYFYINTYKPEQRPKYTMQALAFHEAVPGHHLQIALQQELTNLPAFRRHGGYTAFIEGWGLYSERLPKEVGFYNDPYSEFGRLTFEAWRACRLVVDPGIHHLGWTRQQAIDFMRENTGLSDLNIESEVDRYIAWPGQATAYKIGQLKILELRARAQETLGPRFDRRAFHDALLSDGALPLDLLEQKMTRWIEAIPKD